MKPPLITKLNLAMADPSSAVRLASRIVLGTELKHLQQELGYEGCGAYLSFRDTFKPGERMTWPQYCLAVAGISERSAATYWRCGQACLTRLRCLKRSGWEKLHRKMQMQPSKMTDAERTDMIDALIAQVLTKGETQQQLLREYRGVHLPALETDRAKLAETGSEERGISAKELMDRYPDEQDLHTYTWAKTLRMDEETARLLVIVTKELRRREGLAVNKLG